MDLETAILSVDQTLTLGEREYELDEEQKSSTSGRPIHLDARTVGVLRMHRERQLFARRAAREVWQDTDLAFCDELGQELSPPAVSQAFRPACVRAGVPGIRFHDLRHTHACLLLRVGVNPKVVSERLGHSSVAFTLDTYAHAMPGMQPEAAEMYSRLVFDGQADDGTDLERLVRRMAELLVGGATVDDVLAQVVSNAKAAR